LHDDTHVLDVEVSYVRGPLYHFGKVTFTGLTAADEARARKTWRHAPGSPYDYAYLAEFLNEFSRTLDGRVYGQFRSKTTAGAGDDAMDIEMIFPQR